MIAIVDYGLGNVQAFANIYKRLNIPAEIVAAPDELREESRIILPGVGAFDWAMKRLNASGLRERLDALVMGGKTPVLGICVGMQMMARRSDEGVLDGLGWVDAQVRRFDAARSPQIQLPHMGWNDVVPCRENGLFKSIEKDARFYFLHSYYCLPEDGTDALSHTDYHGEFTSGICHGNVFGVQFHPEKSHQWGIQLLKNFAEQDLC